MKLCVASCKPVWRSDRSESGFATDGGFPFQMAAINAKLYPQMETIFLTASESTHFISSRFVKEIARLGGDISQFVSPKVARKLKDYFKG